MAGGWHAKSGQLLGVSGAVWIFLSGAFLILAAWKRLDRGMARAYGKDIEKDALADIRKHLPKNWKMTTTVMTPYGDVDMFIYDDLDKRFAIEIKSHTDIKVHYFLWFFWPSLRHKNGRKLQKDPIAQTKTIANHVQATPILWFPKHTAGKIAQVQGIWVVMGDRSQLVKAIRKG